MTRWIVSAAAAVAVAVGLVAIGRHEHRSEQSSMLNGIARVRAAIGPNLTSPGPNDYQEEYGLECLIYGHAGRSYALEICTDPAGRVLQAMDRRGLSLEVYTVRHNPSAATIRVPPGLVASLITQLRRKYLGTG